MARRKLVWARTPVISMGLTAAAEGDSFDLLSGFRNSMGLSTATGVGGPPGLTVARVRLSVFAASLTAGAIPMFVGVRVMNAVDQTEAAGGGAEGLEVSPNRDPHADWMLWAACFPNHGSDPTTGVPNALTYDFDVRAMRKLDEVGLTLSLVIGKETSTNAATLSAAASVLLMLP